MAIVRSISGGGSPSSSGDYVSSGKGAARTGSESSLSDGSGDRSEIDSGMESDDLDYAALGEAGSEFCQVEGSSCLVPYEIYDLPDLSQVLSLDSWNGCLTEDERAALTAFLPDMDQETFMLTIRDLFAGKNFHFGSPMAALFELLKGGMCEPRVVLYRRGLTYIQRRQHFFRLAEYHNSMVGTFLQMRDLWKNCVGYGVQERLRVYNLQKSRRKLGYAEHSKPGAKVELETDASFMGKWNRRLNDVGRQQHSSGASAAPGSRRGHLQEEASRYQKESTMGTRKVAGPKIPMDKGSSAKVGYRKGTPPSLVPTGLVKSAAFDYSYGGNSRPRNKDRELFEEEYNYADANVEDREMPSFRSMAKHGKDQQNFRRRHDHSSPLDYGDEERQDYSGLSLFGRMKDVGRISSAALMDSRVLKKSKGNSERLSLKGEWTDSPVAYLHSQKGNMEVDEYSMGHSGRYSERSNKRRLSEKEDSDAYLQKSAYHDYSDHLTHSSGKNIRGKQSQNVSRDSDYVNARSPLFLNKTIDSDSSEQAEEEDFVSMRLKKIKHSNINAEKHQNALFESTHDLNSSKKSVKKVKKNGGVLSQIPEGETYQSAGLKTQTRVDNRAHGYATKTPSPGKLTDGNKNIYEMREEMEEDHYGQRHKVPLVTSHSVGRMRKGPNTELPQPNMHDFLSSAFMEKDGAPEAISGQVVMPGNTKPELDINGQLCMPLSGCKSAATKKKQDKSRQPLGGLDKLADAVISKKNSKKKSEEGCTVMIPENVSPQKEAVVEPEPKPSRKPFTPITPTVHTGFSFSVVHLLSAVRKAMITVGTDDIAVIGNVDSKGNADAMSSEEEKSMRSLTVQEIVDRVKSNPGDPCILETQEPLQDLVRGVLKIFSSKTAPLGVKAWKPLVMYEKSTKSWSWIGPLPPSMADPVEEETSPEAWDVPHKMLVKLVDTFANWLKSGQEILRKIGSLPPPPIIALPNLDEKERFKELRAQKSLNTISASNDEVREYFRKEELLRYQIPERAFSYTAADGRKSTVAPLRRGGGKPTSKARDHFMLKHGRPPHVTLLCLVRDAAARLPGSIGTRADVCTLIRDSQYIVEDVSDNQVNQIVSGALDRLHYERDPCVQYDGDRKLWVYLHRDREEEDFEDDGTSSTKKWKRPKKDAAENADADAVGNNNFDGDQDAGVLSVFEINSDPNNDPSSAQMGDKSELLYSDLRPTDENVEPLMTSVQGSSHQGQRLPWDVHGMNPVQHGEQMLCQQNYSNENFEDETFVRGRTVGLINASLL